MEVPSLLRLAEHKALSKISLSGSVLDLGGDTRSTYRSCFKGKPVFTTVNLDPKSQPNIQHDLEQLLPFADGSYDHVVLINVLEHVYNYQQLLSEARRVVRTGGSVVVVVPYVFPHHPSPRDYWRFSRQAVHKIMESSGLSVQSIDSLGSGVFKARYVLLGRLLPFPLRLLSFWTTRHVACALDLLFAAIAKSAGKKYQSEDYALGFIAVAKKND